MKQVFLQKGSVNITDVAPPLMNDYSILVNVHYSFISAGTEQATIHASNKSLLEKYTSSISEQTNKVLRTLKEHGISGTIALTKEKLNKLLPLGYSCAGQVMCIGPKVERLRVGDYVACAGASFANHADIVSVPQNLAVKIKNPQILRSASMSAIGAIALQGFRRANLQMGDSVCIIGLGLIGHITAQLALHAGCKVVGIDIKDSRLALARKIGVTTCFNARESDVIKEIEFLTGHHGVDATIITAASGSGTVIQQAMHVTRRKGRVVLVGDVKIDFDRDPFYSKEIDFLISCSYGPGRYDVNYEHQNIDYPYAYVRWTENRNMAYFIELLENNSININDLITHEFAVQDVIQAYEAFEKEQALGIVLSYLHSETDRYNAEMPEITHFYHPAEKDTFKPYVPQQGKLNIGFIGVGGFAKIKILPTICKIRNTRIHSIIDTDTPNAITIARLYEANRVSNDYRKILGDDDVHVAIIATPHAFHAEQAQQCLQTGKAVLVEKPAAVSLEQLNMLKKFFSMHKDFLYCVDFNRSHSPFMKEIKDIVSTRTNPLLVNYRMNANYLPKNHWIQSEEHKGRIIGEACHIFELFCFLTGSQPVSITVNSLNPTTDDLVVTDNIVTTITMNDGSCCSLLYSSLGNHAAGKEYMEIFFDGKSIFMNDFLELRGYGLPRAFNKRVKTQDKGHEQLITQFFKAARSNEEPSPIPLERIIMATELSLVADMLARQGGGIQHMQARNATSV